MSHLYEVRGSEIYPTIHNDLYSYISSPVFEVRGNEVYPTIHNDQYNYTSSPVFEIRGDEVLSTTWNPHFPYGEPAALVTTRHDGAGAVGSNDISFDGIAYAAAAGAGFFAALKTYEHVEGRRDMKARKRTDRTESLAASGTARLVPHQWRTEVLEWRHVDRKQDVRPCRRLSTAVLRADSRGRSDKRRSGHACVDSRRVYGWLHAALGHRSDARNVE